MKRQTEQQDTFNKIMKVGKRIAITILCCVPVLVLFGYYTQNIIKDSWLQIICFMAIMGVAVLIVELIARKREKKKQAQNLLNDKKDVWK